MRLVIFAIMAVVLASPASAASQRDRHDCEANDPDRSIAGCTRILQGRGETAQNRGMAYNKRGNGPAAAAGRPPAIQCDGAKLIGEDSAGLVK